MDRAPNLVLECSHKFCDECFRQWFVLNFSPLILTEYLNSNLGQHKAQLHHHIHVHFVAKI